MKIISLINQRFLRFIVLREAQGSALRAASPRNSLCLLRLCGYWKNPPKSPFAKGGLLIIGVGEQLLTHSLCYSSAIPRPAWTQLSRKGKHAVRAHQTLVPWPKRHSAVKEQKPLFSENLICLLMTFLDLYHAEVTKRLQISTTIRGVSLRQDIGTYN